ncbi:Gfo/Idh/MocA family oxidoreductase [Paenibacillus sp. 1001270B_150601_E10]|uniref:Gfo/Idh/MocA family oxidoreductase n=1 Tax=Paenibacillus sp. 1001270B_150601_E10 TaxID=2787079 RepID=UPI002B4BDA33|nr:Gfo/Idh/MocA family oxidoreductase [Paenibacillus sp. 1001270B_150601_E10]
MKVIFFGLGSIGKRHLQNLITLYRENSVDLEVHAYRTKATDEKIEGLDKCIFECDQINDHYDATFITNPTAIHFETLNLMNEKSKFFFIEKPVFDHPNYRVNTSIDPSKVYVAAPLRYKPIMSYLKTYLEDKRIYSARIMCSSYLPTWRKGDYRKSYSASRELGGGVELDCIHELDYVTWLFGFPKQKKHLLLKTSDLSIESNDLALYLLEYEDKVIEVHLDYFGVFSQRKIEIITNDDLVVCDLLNDTLSSQRYGQIVDMKRDVNEMYIEEMKYFIEQVIHCQDNWNDLNNAIDVLKLAKGEINT